MMICEWIRKVKRERKKKKKQDEVWGGGGGKGMKKKQVAIHLLMLISIFIQRRFFFQSRSNLCNIKWTYPYTCEEAKSNGSLLFLFFFVYTWHSIQMDSVHKKKKKGTFWLTYICNRKEKSSHVTYLIDRLIII